MQQSGNYVTNPYLITAISNIHAGSGDANYGVIDKEVQRDVISQLPTIHASGLKGAFRELFTHLHDGDPDHNNITYIFGSSNSEQKGDTNKNEAGWYNFYNAQLLVLPVRSDKAPFFRATSPEILKEFRRQLQHFNKDKYDQYESALKALIDINPEENEPVFFEGYGEAILEDYLAKEIDFPDGIYDLTLDLLGENLALFHHNDFKILCEDLPVIARNNLENGISTNLWYEEIVPRESRFFFFLSQPQEHSGFDTTLRLNNDFVQIGANASVGYGYSKITKLGE